MDEYTPYITEEEIRKYGKDLEKIKTWISSQEFQERCFKSTLIYTHFLRAYNLLCSGIPSHDSSIDKAREYYKESKDDE